MQHWRPIYIAFGIFLIALIVRLFFLPPSFTDAQFDPGSVAFDGYYEIANNLLDGNGFSRSIQPPYVPDSVRMPLYPLIIAAIVTIFGSYKALFIIQTILGSISAVLAWLIARRFVGAGISLFVGLATALEPYTAYFTGTILTETIFTTIFLGAVCVFLKYLSDRNLIMLACTTFLLGIATLIRPTTQYVPLIVLAIALWNSSFDFRRFFFVEAPIVLGIFLLVLSPWIIRNYKTFGSIGLVVQPVSTLFVFLVPSTIALEKGISYEEAATQFLDQERLGSIEEINLGNAHEYKPRALAELKKHPVGLVKSIFVTGITFLTHDGYASMLSNRGYSISFAHPPLSELIRHPGDALRFFADLMRGPEALVVLGRIFWILTTILAVTGAFVFWMKKGLTPQLLLIVGLIAYFAATTILIGLAVNARFRVPVNPFIFMFAGYAFGWILSLLPRGHVQEP